MSITAGLLSTITSISTLSPILLAPLLIITTLSIYTVYTLVTHPLRHIPGPLLSKLTSLPFHISVYTGCEAQYIRQLHEQYGRIVVISPQEVSISDADAVGPIYVSRGGFRKAPYYRNFDVDGHETIFSTTDSAQRQVRARAVAPLFATAAIRANGEAIAGCVDRFARRLAEEAAQKPTVDVLNLSRCLAVDAVSTHLFAVEYGGTQEGAKRLSASSFVDAYVAVGRFFYLPPWLFTWIEVLAQKIAPEDEETARSMEVVDKYVANLVSGLGEGVENYPGRLRKAGISDDEVRSQCKDLMFAGTDSTAMNLATILRELSKSVEAYEKLHKEIVANATSAAPVDVFSLPYLSAVIKEGTRLSMANPTRLPHVVPDAGWTFKGVYFPPGTIVGCSAYELHLNPEVFPSPKAFIPERWLAPEDGSDSAEKGLDSSADATAKTKHYFAFGAGPRACIARNLAMTELTLAVERVARGDLLRGARAAKEGDVEIVEWFNSRVKGEKIELVWDKDSKSE